MQKTKSVFKKICTCLLVLVMCLSPILFAGCGGQTDSGGHVSGGGSSSGGSSSGGSSSGGSSSNSGSNSSSSNGIKEKPEDFFQNYKISYRATTDDEIQAFVADIKKQNNEIAFDIIRLLFSQYGGVIDDMFAIENNIVYVTLDNNGNYIQSTARLSEDKILKQTNPYFSQKIQIYGSAVQPLIEYSATAGYAKYFTHANAISNDSVDATGNILRWNWGADISGITSGEVRHHVYQNFVNNLALRKKVELALLLITYGYDISPTGANHDLYEQGEQLIDSLANQYLPAVNVVLSSANSAIEFYEQVDSQLFNKYYSLIDHSGFTESEINAVSAFICNEIIGESLVSLDQTRYINVVAVEGQHNFEKSLYLTDYTTSRFVGEETILSLYCPNYTIDNSFNYLSTEFFMTDESGSEVEYCKPDDITVQEADQINQIMFYSRFLPLNAGGELRQTITGDQNEIYFDGTTDILDAKLFYNFFDLDHDGVYHSDIADQNNDGDKISFITFDDGYNINSVFSIRMQYFKNYVNTSVKVADNIINALADEQFKTEYKLLTGKDYPFAKKYPVIPASYYADYDNNDMLFNNEGDICHMYSGYKSYQNMVLMPKQDVLLEECILFFMRQNDSVLGSAANFTIKIYARYYDAESNTFATWGEEQSQFYKIDDVTVKYIERGPGAVLNIKTREILSQANIGGVAKGNAILPAFPPVEFADVHQPVLISKYNESAKLYDFVELPDGEKVVCYSAQLLPEEERTSYFELIFAAESSNSFQFCFFPSLFSEPSN